MVVFLEKSRCIYFLRNPLITSKTRASLVAQLLKNPLTMQEMWGSSPESGRSPGEGNPLLA